MVLSPKPTFNPVTTVEVYGQRRVSLQSLRVYNRERRQVVSNTKKIVKRGWEEAPKDYDVGICIGVTFTRRRVYHVISGLRKRLTLEGSVSWHARSLRSSDAFRLSTSDWMVNGLSCSRQGYDIHGNSKAARPQWTSTLLINPIIIMQILSWR